MARRQKRKHPSAKASCESCSFRENIISRSEDITKSIKDSKFYRHIELSNGLRALLISDPHIPSGSSSSSSVEISSSGSEVSVPQYLCSECQAKFPHWEIQQSAAAICVRTGYFSDPPEFPGLAHLLEHMVFMGSKEFPNINGFDSFCSKMGALTDPNARTECENMLFFFDIERNFPEALYRFAQFFTSPLLKKECISSELKNIDSEFVTKIAVDAARKQQLLASLAEKGHPMGNFVWGNLQCLQIDPEKRGFNLYNSLKKFQEQAFSADRMTLALVSPASLDEMEMWVAKYFSKIPVSKQKLHSYANAGLPFKPEKFAKVFRVVPVAAIRELEFTWCLPSQLKHYRSKPLAYLSWLVGHEGYGSLSSYLRNKYWATNVWCQNGCPGFVHNTTWSAFHISISLTAEGQIRMDEIIMSVFAYLAMLKQKGPQRYIYEEIKTIYENAFTWEEEAAPVDMCEFLCGNMCLYDVKDILTGGSLLFEYNPEQIEFCLNELKPGNVNICVYSKDFESLSNLTEKWFSTKYSVSELDEAFLHKLENTQPYPEFHLPRHNPFVTRNFTLVEEEPQLQKDVPSVILSNERCKMWYKPDLKYKTPRVIILFHLISPVINRSPQSAALFEMFTRHLTYNLMDATYQANLADLWCGFHDEPSGLVLSFQGYQDKLWNLYEIVADHVKNFKITEETFQVVSEELANEYHNLIISPVWFARELKQSLLQLVYWPSKDKVQYLRTLNADHLAAFVQEFKESVYIEGYACGNVTSKDALKYAYHLCEEMEVKTNISTLHNPLSLLLGPKLLPCRNLPEVRMVRLQPGDSCFKLRSYREGDTSSCVLNYYQIGPASVQVSTIAELIVSEMWEPCFAFLRTKGHLGYDVSCSHEVINGIAGILIAVETDSSKFTMNEVDAKIEQFLSWFSGKISIVTKKEFLRKLEAQISQRELMEYSLEDEVKRYWSEIFTQEYLFDRLEREADMLKNLTVKDFQSSYRQCLEAPLRRKLSIQVYGSSKRSKCSDDEEKDEKQPHSKKRRTSFEKTPIKDIELFKQELFSYPTKIQLD